VCKGVCVTEALPPDGCGVCVWSGGGVSKPCHKVIGMGEDVMTKPASPPYE
jgi:hypothetical protein